MTLQHEHIRPILGTGMTIAACDPLDVAIIHARRGWPSSSAGWLAMVHDNEIMLEETRCGHLYAPSTRHWLRATHGMEETAIVDFMAD